MTVEQRTRSLGRRISKIYDQAEKELAEKVDSFFADFERLDKKQSALVNAGKLSEEEYKKWRKNKLLMGEKYKQLRDNVGQTMLKANETAAAIINRELIPTYATGYNFEGHKAEDVLVKYSFDLIDEEAVKRLTTSNKTILPYKIVDGRRDVRWNTKKVNSAILQGIIQGESVPKIAKRLMNVTKMNEVSAVRNARTALAGAHNRGRFDAMKKLDKDGVIMQKEWLATTGDGRTRDAHLELHHVVIDYDKPFENSIGRIMFPCDPNAHPSNVYNCRCSMVSVIKGFRKPEEDSKPEEEKQELDYSVSGLAEPERPRRSDFEDEDAYYEARDKYRAEREEYDKKFNEVVDKAVSVKRFDTKDDVIAWAKNNGIKIDDNVLETIDLRSMNETSMALDEMFSRFPEIKRYQIEDFDGSIFWSDFNIGLDDSGMLSANGGLNFNPRIFEDYEGAVRSALRGQVEGYFVKGDGTFSSFIRHEYGHNVQSYIETTMAQEYHYYVDDWRKNYNSFDEYKQAESLYLEKKKRYKSELLSLANLSGSSEYSNTNEHELFAEGFAEWTSGGQTEFGKAFGEFLRRWYK